MLFWFGVVAVVPSPFLHIRKDGESDEWRQIKVRARPTAILGTFWQKRGERSARALVRPPAFLLGGPRCGDIVTTTWSVRLPGTLVGYSGAHVARTS